jgi:hypothetical protein
MTFRLRGWRFSADRTRDPHTRFAGVTVSRGFGVHLRLDFWWWSLSAHRRDPVIEAALRNEINRLEALR